MAKNAYVPEDYRILQESLLAEQKAWRSKFTTLKVEENLPLNPKIPIIHQINWSISNQELLACLEAICQKFSELSPHYQQEIQKIITLLDEDLALKWIMMAIAINESYFKKFAEDNEIETWLPGFIAENANRPFLQRIAELVQEHVKEMSPVGGCPCCGEPPRLAELTKGGKKSLLCPRCHTAWVQKKIACAYCGTDDHTQIRIMTIEDNSSENIYLCLSCHNYTKVISTSKLLTKPEPANLDLNTIHLDYLAQNRTQS